MLNINYRGVGSCHGQRDFLGPVTCSLASFPFLNSVGDNSLKNQAVVPMVRFLQSDHEDFITARRIVEQARRYWLVVLAAQIGLVVLLLGWLGFRK